MDQLVRKVTQTKFLILLGITFLASALVVNMGEVKFTRQTTSVMPTFGISPTIPAHSGVIQNAGQKIQLDINGSYQCEYASTSAVVSKKRLHAVNSSEKIPVYTVFKGDCLYTWKKDARAGVKKCGLGQFVSMYESVSKLGIGDPSNMISMVLDSGITDSLMEKKQQASFSKSLISSCNSLSAINENLFDLPKTVTFSERKEK